MPARKMCSEPFSNPEQERGHASLVTECHVAARLVLAAPPKGRRGITVSPPRHLCFRDPNPGDTCSRWAPPRGTRASGLPSTASAPAEGGEGPLGLRKEPSLAPGRKSSISHCHFCETVRLSGTCYEGPSEPGGPSTPDTLWARPSQPPAPQTLLPRKLPRNRGAQCEPVPADSGACPHATKDGTQTVAPRGPGRHSSARPCVL